MPSNPWTPAEDALAQHLTEEGKDSAEIAAVFAERGVARTQKAIQRRRERQGWHAKVAASPVRPLAGPLVAEGDMLILPDPHCPFHDAAWVNRCIDLALSWGIELAGIPGDLIDWTAFSHYGRHAGVEAEDEIRAAEQFKRRGVHRRVHSQLPTLARARRGALPPPAVGPVLPPRRLPSRGPGVPCCTLTAE